MPGAHARRARSEVIARLQDDRFDASGMRRHGEQEVDVGGPAVALHHRLVAGRPHGVTNHGDTEEPEAAQGVVHARNPNETTNQPAADALQLTHRLRHFGVGRRLTNHDIRSPLETLHQLGDLVRSVSQVPLHEDNGVPAGVAAAIQRRAEERVDRFCVSDMLGPSHNGDRQGIGVRRKHLRCCVRAAVVEHDQFVFAREVGERLADAPQHEPRGGGLVMYGNADVEH